MISKAELRESHPTMKEFYEWFIYNDQKLNMGKKLDEILVASKLILDQFDIKTILTSKFDEFGEILHDSVIEKFKAECVEMMDIIKSVKNFDSINNIK
jgi:hypothetical protein